MKRSISSIVQGCGIAILSALTTYNYCQNQNAIYNSRQDSSIAMKEAYQEADPTSLSQHVRDDCSVNFKDPSMALCHIIPWPNFGDELGPPVVKRILELHFGCSAANLTVSNLATHYAGGGDYGFFNRSIA